MYHVPFYYLFLIGTYIFKPWPKNRVKKIELYSYSYEDVVYNVYLFVCLWHFEWTDLNLVFFCFRWDKNSGNFFFVIEFDATIR